MLVLTYTDGRKVAILTSAITRLEARGEGGTMVVFAADPRFPSDNMLVSETVDEIIVKMQQLKASV